MNFLKNNGNFMEYFQVKDYSMCPTLQRNDKVILTRRDAVHNDIVAVYFNNELLIKRLKYVNDVTCLTSDNYNELPIIVSEFDSLEFVGVVTGRVSQIQHSTPFQFQPV